MPSHRIEEGRAFSVSLDHVLTAFPSALTTETFQLSIPSFRLGFSVNFCSSRIPSPFGLKASCSAVT